MSFEYVRAIDVDIFDSVDIDNKVKKITKLSKYSSNGLIWTELTFEENGFEISKVLSQNDYIKKFKHYLL